MEISRNQWNERGGMNDHILGNKKNCWMFPVRYFTVDGIHQCTILRGTCKPLYNIKFHIDRPVVAIPQVTCKGIQLFPVIGRRSAYRSFHRKFCREEIIFVTSRNHTADEISDVASGSMSLFIRNHSPKKALRVLPCFLIRPELLDKKREHNWNLFTSDGTPNWNDNLKWFVCTNSC
jgi:hypothetical protein